MGLRGEAKIALFGVGDVPVDGGEMLALGELPARGERWLDRVQRLSGGSDALVESPEDLNDTKGRRSDRVREICVQKVRGSSRFFTETTYLHQEARHCQRERERPSAPPLNAKAKPNSRSNDRNRSRAIGASQASRLSTSLVERSELGSKVSGVTRIGGHLCQSSRDLTKRLGPTRG